jgi:hypothetical protein
MNMKLQNDGRSNIAVGLTVIINDSLELSMWHIYRNIKIIGYEKFMLTDIS